MNCLRGFCVNNAKMAMLTLATGLCVLSCNFKAEAASGWYKSGVDWYYTDATNTWVEDNGEYYYVDANGKMLVSQYTPDKFYVDRTGKCLTTRNCLSVMKSIHDGLNSPGKYILDTSINGKRDLDNIVSDYRHYFNTFNKCFNKSSEVTFDGNYLADYSNVNISVRHGDYSESESQVVRDAATNFLNQLDPSLSTDDMITSIAKYVASQCDYDYSLQKSDPYDVIANHSSVCDGYTRLFYQMCWEKGLKVRYLSGYADNGEVWGSHSWNQVWTGDRWRNVDVTWYDTGLSEAWLDFSNEELAKRQIDLILE